MRACVHEPTEQTAREVEDAWAQEYELDEAGWIANMILDISPPEATFSTACTLTPLFAENKNENRSRPAIE